VRRESQGAKTKKPILFENRLKFNPKMFIKISSPPEVDPFIPKIQFYSNFHTVSFFERKGCHPGGSGLGQGRHVEIQKKLTGVAGKRRSRIVF
jgi:hypothetical protein